MAHNCPFSSEKSLHALASLASSWMPLQCMKSVRLHERGQRSNNNALCFVCLFRHRARVLSWGERGSKRFSRCNLFEWLQSSTRQREMTSSQLSGLPVLSPLRALRTRPRLKRAGIHRNTCVSSARRQVRQCSEARTSGS